ncbi:hypothetical protein [Longimicrobium sp.]|uniref:hypothetical protein n=1 Tax=Longimicrobium sp. TaxID=2029185 RepID=UPI003B3ABD30
MNPRVPATFIILAVTAVAACGDHGVTEPRVATSAPAATELEIACAYPDGARIVQVSTSTQLTAALANAQPGDFIQMAGGTYTGPFSATVSGTAGQRITLCGNRDAVIQTGSTSTLGFALRIRASYWTLTGFTVTSAQQGVSVEGGAYNDVQNLAVHGIGQEAIKLFKLSSYNTVRNNHIYDTGVWYPEWGEGVYVGSYNGHWTANSGGQPDASDYNQVLNNVFGPDVRAEHIDVKEGTTGGLIDGNTFDGRGMVQSQTWVDSWVEIKGNGYTVSGNTGAVSIRDGFQSYQVLAGWGYNNTFAGNVADVQASGYGFRVDNGMGHVVRCDNQVTNAGTGYANVACTP